MRFGLRACVLAALLAVPSSADAPTAARFVAAAIALQNPNVIYDGGYRRIAYPMGDVASNRGVCADVVVRAYRGIGIDLQRLVHDDMRAHFDAYPHALRLICDLQLGTMQKDDRFTLLVRSDIRKQPEECARDLAMHIFNSGRSFLKPFLVETDFASKYDLRPDRILTDDELVGWDPTAEQYRDSSYQQLSLRERQENVAAIQLIPQVPEDVKEVIRRAKRLYIFGHFEYSFFTVADHYAYAALEAALIHRWNATLPDRLQLLYKHKNRQESAVVDRMGWRRIQDYCNQQGWRPQYVQVNGRTFPATAGKVVDRLHDDRILSDWQHWRMRKVYLLLRNSHSHLEFCSTSMPGADTIQRVVREINTLFESLPPVRP